MHTCHPADCCELCKLICGVWSSNVNSSNVSQLETLRGPWKIPLFSSIFHKALSDGIMVCWYVLVDNSGNLLVWFSSFLWMFILHWVAFCQDLTALSHRVCFCPKSFISNERIELKRKQANKFCISMQDNHVGGCRGWYPWINTPHPFPVWVMPPMQHPQSFWQPSNLVPWS